MAHLSVPDNWIVIISVIVLLVLLPEFGWTLSMMYDTAILNKMSIALLFNELYRAIPVRIADCGFNEAFGRIRINRRYLTLANAIECSKG